MKTTRAWWLLLVLALLVSGCNGDSADPVAEDEDDPAVEAEDDTAAEAEDDPAAEGTDDAAAEEADDAAAEGTDDAAPVGDADGEPIRIAGIFDLSGATADVGTPYAEGMRGYVEWRNGEGGIAGRPIELLSQDYQYDVAIAEQLYSQYVSEGVVAVQGWGTGDTEALRGRITSDELPFMSASYAETLIDPAETPYNFVVALSYSSQLRVALRHIDDTTEETANVAVFHHDSPFGESPLADGQAYIEDEGLDVQMQTIAMPAGATDYTGELAQAGDVDYIVIQNVTTPAAQLANNVFAQGLEATIVCLNWCADEGFIELAGDAAEGAMGVLPFAPPPQADGLDDVVAFLETQDQTLEDIDLHFTQGWYTMDVMAHGIEQAIADTGEATGPSIRDGLETMGAVETPVTVPIEFSGDNHAGMDSGTIYEVQDGTWAPVSDVITP